METNEQYLQRMGIQPDTQTYTDCLAVLNGYGDNHWWLSSDPRERAYWQTVEMDETRHSGKLLMPYKQFASDLTTLLGRAFFTHEQLIDPALPQEAERAWRYGVGVTSEQERQEREGRALSNLNDIAQRLDKPIITIDPMEE